MPLPRSILHINILTPVTLLPFWGPAYT